MNGPVFVTGGTGFVGRGVLQQLADTGAEVRALARDRTGGESLAALGATPVIGHLFEPEVLERGMAGAQVVYHVAGVNQLCTDDPTVMRRVNVEGPRAVIRAAASTGVPRVVHTSSAATIGEPRGTVGTEAAAHRGSFLSHYERSKYDGERAAFEEGARLGVEVVCVNPSSVQGPGRTRGSARILLTFLERRIPVLVETHVSLVDIDDCSRGHLLAAQRGRAGERYLLSGATLDIRSAAALLSKVTGKRISPVVIPRSVAAALATPFAALAGNGRPDQVFCRETLRTVLHGHRFDGSRASHELGLEYTPVAETLERTIRWYVEYGFVTKELPRIRRS